MYGPSWKKTELFQVPWVLREYGQGSRSSAKHQPTNEHYTSSHRGKCDLMAWIQLDVHLEACQVCNIPGSDVIESMIGDFIILNVRNLPTQQPF